MRVPTTLWFVAIMMMCGCLNYRSYNPYDRYYPKRPVWRLRNGEPDPDNKLCYDCVYAAKIEDDYYMMLRFWPTGQVMIQADVTFNKDLSNSFQGSGIGYFMIKDGVFWLEQFGDVNFGSYGSRKGYFDPSGNLVVTHFGVRSRFPSLNLYELPDPWIFVRITADLKELTPDW